MYNLFIILCIHDTDIVNNCRYDRNLYLFISFFSSFFMHNNIYVIYMLIYM